MSHVLREFRKEDSKGVNDLILAILTVEYPFHKSVYSDTDLERIGEVYGGKRDAFFVIEEDGAIVGTAGVKEDGKEDALLRRLFVSSSRRNRGYGSELLQKALDFCREKGYSHVYFRCTDRMSDAMKLCMKRGFKEKERLEVSGFKIHRLVLEL